MRAGGCPGSSGLGEDSQRGVAVSEELWIAGIDPHQMSQFLGAAPSERKLRLFACACARRVWHTLFAGDPSRRAVESAERFADNPDNPEELKWARAAIVRALEWHPGEWAFDVAYWTCSPSLVEQVWGAASCAALTATKRTLKSRGHAQADQVRAREEEVQSSLLRDIFGNPFSPVAFDPRWLTTDVVALARGIYEDRAFDRLPLLADALMDAGCDSDDILSHCRSEGPHVRGCWVVDLVLGKE